MAKNSGYASSYHRDCGDAQINLVFLGGIHGAGKSQLGSRLATACGALHVSAGELIRIGRTGREITKRVADIPGNQQLLISGINNRLAAGRDIILDGHFAVLDDAGAPREISLDTYRQLKPIGAIFLRVDPKESHRRLLARDNQAPTIIELERLQATAQAQALNVVDHLNIPLLVVSDVLSELATDFVIALIRDRS